MMSTETNWESLARKAEYKPALLAKKCGVSLRTLQRHFNKNYGVTVRDWLRHVRMCEAYSRLLAGQRVKEVAIDLAYKQVSHFSRDFKCAYGVPPSDLTQTHPKWNDALPAYPTHLSGFSSSKTLGHGHGITFAR